MDECLQILSVQPECANDETLVQLVQLQLVVEKVGHWQEEMENDTEHSKMPPTFFIASLTSRLEEIGAKTSFPTHSSGKFCQLPPVYSLLTIIKSYWLLIFTAQAWPLTK
jgi:hypothetical protein